MPPLTKPLDFSGTEEEYNTLLNEEVAIGNISPEVADALLAAFTTKNANLPPLQTFVKKDAPIAEKSFLDSLIDKAIDFGGGLPKNVTIDPTAKDNTIKVQGDVTLPYSGMSNAKLTALNNKEAFAELSERDRIQKLSFLDSLSDSSALTRMGRTALKSFPQAAFALTEGLPGLAAMGIEKLTGADLNSQAMLQDMSKHTEALNTTLGVSDPITATESFAESVVGAAIPGGILAKAAGMGTDFLIDQGVRELIDDKGEKYETVFDRVGITNNDAPPAMGIVGALGLGILGGSLGASAVAKLMRHRIGPTKFRDISEIDPHAPKGLKTVEKASDLTFANIVDEQAALERILGRFGFGNMTDLSARINLDTHAAANVRIQQALHSGKLTANNAVFNSPVAPIDLYKAYNKLPHITKAQVAKYINLKDQRDDLILAVAKGNAQQLDVYKIERRIAQIKAAVPEAEMFSVRYNVVTKGLRDFAEGSLFSTKYRIRLNKTRPNYVPLELSSIDPSAPFLTRAKQAQSDTSYRNSEWFMENRTSTGLYDITKRPDPFDLMLQNAEATLAARMKNDTKVAIVDSMLTNPLSKQTIQKVTGDDIERYSNRLIKVYRNGEKEHYVTSKLVADLIRFDPYIAKAPWAFIPKRLFEHAAVGPLSITFAPVTLIRDALGANITRPKGLLTAGPIGVLAAIPEQLLAKAQGGIASYLKQSLFGVSQPTTPKIVGNVLHGAKKVVGKGSFPEWLMNPQQQEKFANEIAESFTKTFYYMANEAGGADASLMKNKIRIGQGRLTEAKKTVEKHIDNINIPGVSFTKRRIVNMFDGFVNVFNAVQEASRYAANKKTVAKTGMSIGESTRLARLSTGDVTHSGRVYGPRGRIDVDAVDQGLLNAANKNIGEGTEALRESTPFINPMVQGVRRLLNSFVDDPIGTNMRAWTYVSMPTVAAFGWNEMLGPEYNDYAMNRRSGRDVAMSLYMGFPGKPPEEGIEWPWMHELMPFSAPLTQALYSMTRGQSQERMRGAFALVAENILTNSLEIGFPVVLQGAANIAGYAAPDSLIRPSKNPYMLKEDDLGVLPENLEQLIRTLTASVGSTAVNTANAIAGDPTFESFYKEVYNNTVSRTPIVKNVLGLKRSNVTFSMPKQMAYDKFKAYGKFRKYYTAFLEPKKFNKDGLARPASKKRFTSLKNLEQPLKSKDLPFLVPGPEQLTAIDNPLYKAVGAIIVDSVGRNNQGMSGLVDRERTYSRYAKYLRKYNAGDRKALQKWQGLLSGITATDNDTRRLKELIVDNSIDLSKYEDRIKLHNMIEERRADIVAGQLDLFDRIEADITKLLRQKGMLDKDKKFSITKHLDPHDFDPLGTKK